MWNLHLKLFFYNSTPKSWNVTKHINVDIKQPMLTSFRPLEQTCVRFLFFFRNWNSTYCSASQKAECQTSEVESIYPYVSHMQFSYFILESIYQLDTIKWQIYSLFKGAQSHPTHPVNMDNGSLNGAFVDFKHACKLESTASWIDQVWRAFQV